MGQGAGACDAQQHVGGRAVVGEFQIAFLEGGLYVRVGDVAGERIGREVEESTALLPLGHIVLQHLVRVAAAVQVLQQLDRGVEIDRGNEGDVAAHRHGKLANQIDLVAVERIRVEPPGRVEG